MREPSRYPPRFRPAAVIHCSPPDKRPTELLSFDRDEAATAWIAEMRAARSR